MFFPNGGNQSIWNLLILKISPVKYEMDTKYLKG